MKFQYSIGSRYNDLISIFLATIHPKCLVLFVGDLQIVPAKNKIARKNEKLYLDRLTQIVTSIAIRNITCVVRRNFMFTLTVTVKYEKRQ